MRYVKKIVCLANSRKFGGYCFAGKEVLNSGYGDWVRPVSARETEEISKEEQTFADGDCPKLLDVVAVPMLEHRPQNFQQENHLVDDKTMWRKVGRVSHNELPSLLDETPGPLWVNYGGNNDRISVVDARNFRYSLLLIKPDSLNITVDWKPYGRRGEKQIRAKFRHNDHSYNLVVTDLVAETKYAQMSTAGYRKNGRDLPCQYSIPGDMHLCVSLAERPFEGKYFKLVAAIIGDAG